MNPKSITILTLYIFSDLSEKTIDNYLLGGQELQ